MHTPGLVRLQQVHNDLVEGNKERGLWGIQQQEKEGWCA